MQAIQSKHEGSGDSPGLGDLAGSLDEAAFRLGPVFMSQDPLKKVGLM